MDAERFEAFEKALREKCPGTELQIRYLGHRFRVTAGIVTILMDIDEDLDPKHWARKFAEQIHSKQVTV